MPHRLSARRRRTLSHASTTGLYAVLLLSLLGLLSAIAGCGQAQDEPAADAPKADKQDKQDKPAAPIAATPPEPIDYDQLGMPPADRAWTLKELTKAGEVVMTIAARNPKRLPQRDDAETGAVFARLIDRDNLALFNDPARVPAERLELLDQFMAANTDIVQAYAGAFDVKAVGGGELVEIFGSELRLAATALDLADEITPEHRPDRLEDPVRRLGLEQFRLSRPILINGAMKVLVDSQRYTVADRRRMVAHLNDSLPTILPHLPEDSREAAVRMLAELQDREDLSGLQPELRILAGQVRHTVEKTAEKDTDAAVR